MGVVIAVQQHDRDDLTWVSFDYDVKVPAVRDRLRPFLDNRSRGPAADWFEPVACESIARPERQAQIVAQVERLTSTNDDDELGTKNGMVKSEQLRPPGSRVVDFRT